MHRLPFRQVWVVDFEYGTSLGGRPVPVCMVGRELRSGQLLRLWQDELGSRPPFPVGPDSLFVAYAAAAELGCFLELGWPMPARVLDLWVEFLAVSNGRRQKPHEHGLLVALAWHGIPSITKDEKDAMRGLVLRGGPWTPAERAAILDYCQSDVDVLEPLLGRMLPAICSYREGLGHALLRGRYMAAVTAMERTGVPIDTAMLARLRKRWDAIKLDLITAIDQDYHVYDGATFKAERFERWLKEQRIPWERTKTGQLSLDRKVFKEASKAYPQVSPLRELRTSLSEMRLEALEVGLDGRNRTWLKPFCAKSSRNTPSNTRFIFGPSVWLRGLIRPERGRALAYVDWSNQEVVIAAALSGDQVMLDAVASGDPYLHLAMLAGMAPRDATKQTHGPVRALFKTCLLGSNYGMGAAGLAQRLGISVMEAEQLQRKLARAFPVYWEWAEHVVDVAQLRREIRTVFGWTLRFDSGTRPTSLRNFPMQANAAEMLRVACCLATERGVQVCAPVHDALLVEAADDDLEQTVSATREAMAEAARTVLDGVDVATEAVTVRWPERYMDPRGQVMWDRVMGLLDQAAERYGADPEEWPTVAAPRPLRWRAPKGSGERRGLTGMTRCFGCGQWIRKRPEAGDWDEAERAYAGDEYEEHVCEADFGHGLDPTSADEWAAWEESERELREVEEVE